jgi:hypothetical protein
MKDRNVKIKDLRTSEENVLPLTEVVTNLVNIKMGLLNRLFRLKNKKVMSYA